MVYRMKSNDEPKKEKGERKMERRGSFTIATLRNDDLVVHAHVLLSGFFFFFLFIFILIDCVDDILLDKWN